MSAFKITMIANIIIETTFVICVTLAAIHFERIGILAWYLLVLLMGYQVKTQKEEKDVH